MYDTTDDRMRQGRNDVHTSSKSPKKPRLPGSSRTSRRQTRVGRHLGPSAARQARMSEVGRCMTLRRPFPQAAVTFELKRTPAPGAVLPSITHRKRPPRGSGAIRRSGRDDHGLAGAVGRGERRLFWRETAAESETAPAGTRAVERAAGAKFCLPGLFRCGSGSGSGLEQLGAGGASPRLPELQR